MQRLSQPHSHTGVCVSRSLEFGVFLLFITGCQVQVWHDRTDGFSAQYKSGHCMGDVAHFLSDFGYTTVRNHFETSHAKGPQDGAGANLKHKADMAVIKRQVKGNLRTALRIPERK